MELLEGINARRSTRAFKSTPIPKDVLEKILQTAGKSPSYANTQPWEVAVVSGQKKEELSNLLYELGKSGATMTPDIPHPQDWPPELERRSKEHGTRRLQALGIDRADTEQREASTLTNYKFFGAPCVLFLFTDELIPWSMYGLGLFSQSLILAAHSHGVSSCLQAWVANYPDTVRRLLGIPETKKLVIGISLGYPDMEAKANTYRSTRVDIKDFVRWYT